MARKSLQAYNIKMQYEIVIKGDRCCSCYTCLPQTAHAAQTAVKMVAAPGTPLVARSLLAIATPNNHRKHTHICKQKQTLRNSTPIHQNSV